MNGRSFKRLVEQPVTSEGKAIMYADKVTDSMQRAMDETSRRRSIQEQYNEEHGIVPKTIIKEIRDLISISKVADDTESYDATSFDELSKSGTKRTLSLKWKTKCVKLLRHLILRLLQPYEIRF